MVIQSFLLYSWPDSLIELHVGSDTIYMNVLGQSMIVIDKYETAVELLDKRSGIYSSRFVTPIFSREHKTYRIGLSLRCLNSYLGGAMALFFCPMVM